MTPSQIDALVQHYLTTTLEAFESERLEGPATTDEEDEGRWIVLSDLIDGTVEELNSRNYRTVKPVLEGLLKEHGLKVQETAPAYKRLCRALLAAQQRAFTIEMQRMDGDYSAQLPGMGQGSSSPFTPSAGTLA
ncbi:MAG: hypothetical protein M3M98_05065, partial [Nitrospirota bacterium]|nr:hypothetical protein [Nitrospirota bacterium]